MKSHSEHVQYAALPYRLGAHGAEILLITSRHSRRWIIPKGWPMPDRPPHKAAALEALEEAGVTGDITGKPLCSYRRRKRLKDGSRILCAVEVFPLKVSDQLARFPDQGKRLVRWFAPARAAQMVREPALKAAILTIAAWAATGRLRPPRKRIWIDELRLQFEQSFPRPDRVPRGAAVA